MSLTLHTVVVSDFQQNARILFDDQSMQAIIIDPGADVEQLFELTKDYCVLPYF